MRTKLAELGLSLTFVIAGAAWEAADAQSLRNERRQWQDQFYDRRSQSERQQAPNMSSPRLRTYPFHTVPQPLPLPESQGAAFCALTTVDDDTPDGWCKVFFDEQTGDWMAQTGGGNTDQYCEATCMWLGQNGEDVPFDQAPTLRR
jgi:hypothetical protein